MLNLVKVKLKKLGRMNTYRIMLLLVTVISVISAYSQGADYAIEAVTSGMTAFSNVFRDVIMVFASAILAGLFIGADFQNRSLRMNIVYGHSRMSVLMAKAIVYFIAATLLQAIYPIISTAQATIAFGWGAPVTTATVLYILRTFALWMLLNIGTISFFVLSAFICRDIGLTIGMSVGGIVIFMLLAPFLKTIPVLGTIISAAPLALMDRVSLPAIGPGTLATLLLSAVATTLLFLAGAHFFFRKAEIK